MIDFARPHDAVMCDVYFPPAPSEPAPLEDFQVFRKKWTGFSYGNYFSNPFYDSNVEPEVEASTNVYYNLVAPKQFNCPDEWKYKYINDWTENDTLSWLYDTARTHGIGDYYEPSFHNFRISGIALRGMKLDQIVQLMSHPHVDPAISRQHGELVYNRLRARINDEMSRVPSDQYLDGEPYQQESQTVLDLDALDHKKGQYTDPYQPNDGLNMQSTCESSDETDDILGLSETASPECSYGSDGSKSGDEQEEKGKIFKRPPGRPRGSGRKIKPRPRNVSVPQFLRDLLFDPRHCPSIIKWEDHSIGKFRFVKPDEVAKLWGKLKQNENMTFEKFSRAMRYHYKQQVLVSVPTARLVYQFGEKGPNFKTDNPNFVNVKHELEYHNEHIYS